MVETEDPEHDDHDQNHGHGTGQEVHTPTHGIVDQSVLTTERGIRAVKWSFAVLFVTAFLQVIVIWFTGSIASAAGSGLVLSPLINRPSDIFALQAYIPKAARYLQTTSGVLYRHMTLKHQHANGKQLGVALSYHGPFCRTTAWNVPLS